jgi:hypothetical protein
MSDQFDAAKVRLADGTVAYDAVKLAQIETEGIYLKGSEKFPRNIPHDCVITVRTKNSTYTLTIHGDNIEAICERHDGREDHNFLPVQTPIYVSGSTFGGSMLKVGYLGVGMHMEFSPSDSDKVYTTSAIESLSVKPL